MSPSAASAGPPGNSLAQAYVDRCMVLGAAVVPALLAAEDVAYGPGPRQRLDVYRPQGAGEGLPVLVFFHGGGFTSGGKDWCRFMAATVCAFPAVLVCPSYRLVPEASVADQIADCAAATTWAMRNIARFGGAPDRLVVGGHSAGGALAALLAARPGPLAPEVFAGVRAVVCLSATLHQFPITGTPAAGYSVPPGPLILDPDAPLAQAGRMRRPFMIGWGGRERQRERVERSSMAMIDALRDGAQSVEWLFAPEASHFDTHLALGEPGHPWLQALKHWLCGDVA
jgi:acetyl esterase/lipase